MGEYRAHIAKRTSDALEAVGATVRWLSPYELIATKRGVSLRVGLTITGAFSDAYRIDVHPNLALVLRTRKAAVGAIR